MTTLDQPSQTRRNAGRDVLGVVVVALPVSDLARSAAWYRDLLDLRYVREFGDQHDVSGCALADFASHYMIALRRQTPPPGGPTSVVNTRSSSRRPMRSGQPDSEPSGCPRDPLTSGEHADGVWIELLPGRHRPPSYLQRQRTAALHRGQVDRRRTRLLRDTTVAATCTGSAAP